MRLIAGMLSLVMLLCMTSLILPVPLLAQDGASQAGAPPRIDPRKLLVQPRNADGTRRTPSFREAPGLWIMEKQREFYSAMDRSLKEVKNQASLAAAMTLMLLSFGYGVFHAAGPGHGKAVISAWLLATENELRRGIFIAWLSAFIQALTAIAVISTLLFLVTAVGSTSRNVAGFLESASYALVALMGAYLVWTAFWPHQHGAATVSDRKRHPHAQHSAENHFHADAHHHHHDHGHDHAHGKDCGCGHAHVPDVRQVRGDWSLGKALSLALAVGIRPCSGALLVLISANIAGIYWAGITSAFIMALGTAITVSVIAAIAVYSKKLALGLARSNETWLGYASLALRLGGGLVIIALGGILFWGSLFSTNTMM